MLQAESEKLRQAWIQAVQASIASAYKDIADNYYIEVKTHTHVLFILLVCVGCRAWSLNYPLFLCSAWTEQPPPQQAASTLPVSPEIGGRGLIGDFEEGGRAFFRGYRFCQAMNCAVTVAKRLRVGLPSTWVCCSASSVQESTGNCQTEFCSERMREGKQLVKWCTICKNIFKLTILFPYCWIQIRSKLFQETIELKTLLYLR